jgi:hypothetical protein
MRREQHRSSGQALVEFALAATLIFTLLSAAVDLGLLFFSLQAVRVAAQEGANFGRVPVQVLANNKVQSVELDYDQIIARIRSAAGETSAGSRRSVGLVNLYDLDNNGQDDVTQGIVPNPATQRRTTVTSGPIKIDNPVSGSVDELAPIGSQTQCVTDTKEVGMRDRGFRCWARVRIDYTYKFFFPLAPVFGNTVTFPVTYTIQIKSTYRG